jgi:hypothetical protein
MGYSDARSCKRNLKYGSGNKWRLPNLKELGLMNEHNKLIAKTSKLNGGNGFQGDYYWSSKEKSNDMMYRHIGCARSSM